MEIYNINNRNIKIPENAVLVDRTTKWGNPFKKGRDGTRKQVIKRFCEEILPDLDVSELKGKPLICHCFPKDCHAKYIWLKANSDIYSDIFY